MDISTLIGWVMAMGLIVWGIGFEKLGNFWDMQSLAIVVGGAIAALIASYPFRILKEVPKHILILFRGGKYNIPKLVDQMVDLAMLARQSGLLALEEKAEEIKDPFFKQSVLKIVDANDPDKVREMLEKELDDMAARHDEAAGIYEKGSAYAPAFGMIGTLVGLINMLKGMNLDEGGAGSLGTDMGTALITTFYGCILSHLIFSPIARKLRVRNEEELLYKQIMIEGILAIQAGDNPKFLREKLVTFVSQKERQKLLDPDAVAAKGKKAEE